MTKARRWRGRVGFAATQRDDRAWARYAWAKAVVRVKGGFWCFERQEDAATFQKEDGKCSARTVG